MIAEDWRYSNLSRIQGYLNPEPAIVRYEPKVFSAVIESLSNLGSVVCFANGEVNAACSRLEGLKISKEKRSTPLEDHPVLNFSSEKASERFVIALKNAQPLFLVYVANANVQNYQTQITIDRDVEVIEIFLSNSEEAELISVVTEIQVTTGNRLRHSVLNHLGKMSRVSHFLKVNQDSDSQAHFFNLSLASEWSRFDVRNYLKAPGARSSLAGLYLKSESEFVDHCTKVFHQAPNTESLQLYKGVLGGASRAIFNGLVKIDENCPESKTNQLNRNLLVGTKAEAISRPQLEILTDNVKANHGMTVGSLNPAELFYLMSRGIPESKAHDLLTDAFVNEVVDQYVSPTIEPMVRELIGQRWQSLREAIK